MALFKIFKGQAENLPNTYNDGYCYVTIDEGKMYIDTTNAKAGRIVLNAEKADKDIYGQEIHRFYEAMVPQGTSVPSNADLNTTNFLLVGNYYCSKNDTVKTLKNCPTDLAFMMQVYAPLSTTVDNEVTGTWVYRLRKLTTHKGKEYYQFVNSGSTPNSFTYGDWIEKLDSSGTITLTGDVTGTASLSNDCSIVTDISASGVTAGKYGPSANASVAHGKTFVVPEFEVAADGRIISAATRTITLPSDNNTTSSLSAEYNSTNKKHQIRLTESSGTKYDVELKAGTDVVLSTDTANDIITIAHKAITTTSETSTTATDTTPAHGGSFTVVDAIATNNGHVTKYTTKTITLPTDNNTTSALSAEYNATSDQHLIRLTESSGTKYDVELKEGNDITLLTDPDGDAITIEHEAFTTTSTDSTQQDKTPGHGGSFKVIDSITTDNGHITGFTTKSVKLPSDNNTTYTIKASNNVITLDGSTGTDTSVTIAAGDDINVSTGTSDNKITIKHADFTTSSTTSTANDKTPSHGGSFSVVDGITTDNGHITGYTLKSVKLPSDNNTTSSLSAEYDSTNKKHQIRLTESNETKYNVELIPGNDITLATNTDADSITIAHEAFTTTGSDSTATDKTPVHGGSFTVIDSITTDNGHITKYTTKSVKLPSDNNTTYTLDLDNTSKVTLNGTSGTDTHVTFAAGNDLVITPDTTNKKITYKHADFTTTKNATNSTASATHGGTVEVLGSITVDNGHVTGYQNKTITFPSDNNTTYNLSSDTANKVHLKGTDSSDTFVEFKGGTQMSVSSEVGSITVNHGTITTQEGTGTTASPSHGTSFTVLDSITTDNGHVTGFVKKTVTLPGDNNTDTKVGQYVKSDDVNYPLLGAYSASPSSGTASTVVYDTAMHMNPSTNTITATTFAGNATSASKLATARTIGLSGAVTGSISFDGSNDVTINTTANHTHSYLPLAGGTMTGPITLKASVYNYHTDSTSYALNCNNSDVIGVNGIYFADACDGMTEGIHFYRSASTWDSIAANAGTFYFASNHSSSQSTCVGNATIRAGAVYGAVWNDYAEYRTQKETIEPGYCVASSDNGQVYKTTEKFQACDGVVSDTFGFAIGETDECKTPLAVAGRVLAYCEGSKYDYHAGDTVCAGPGGKVCKMTREEIREWPDRIVGVVSEIPEYQTWGSGNIEVNNRIWIKVK